MIGKNVIVVSNLTVTIIKGCQGGNVEIGEGTTFWNTTIQNYDNDSSITIGRDCMFSYNTAVVNTDEHLILKDGKVCNHARDLVIGDHVWVGYNACVMKNSKIADGSIIGRSEVASGKFVTPKSVIVGNPGCVVKTGVDWLRTDVNQQL